jgi:hypothetical protein
MESAMQRPTHTREPGTSRAAAEPERPSRATAIVDNRPSSIAQRRLQRSADTSPRLAARRLLDPAHTGSAAPVQRLGTTTTDALATATPAYLQELAKIHAPGLWDHTNNGAFAVSHKGRKYALGMDDASYSASILKRTPRTKLFGSYHFSQEIDLLTPQLKQDLYAKDCGQAADYLLHKHRGHDPTAHRFPQEEATGAHDASYDPLTERPSVLPPALPGGVKDANAQAGVGEAYCIVSEPNSGQYNFHYGFVAAKKGGEVLTVEGFATGNAATTPDWSFNAYDSVSTFHGVWQAAMTKSAAPFAAGYPFTFVVTLG